MAASLLSNLAVWLTAAAAQAEDPRRIDPVQPSETASYPDAAEVARGSGIGEAEAASRLRMQEVSAPHVSKLRREFADRLAGLYLESEGDYRLVVRLKGPAPVADRWIGGGRDRMRIQFLAGAPATLAETLEKVAAAMPAVGARLPGLMGTGVDERTGEVMLNVYAVGEDVERARASEPELERLLGHPVRLEFSSTRMTDGQGSARPLPRPPAPGTAEWSSHMQGLARSARHPGYPHPGILDFQRESRALARRVQADPAFAGWVFKNDNEPHAVVLFTGDAAAHLARYTSDPRYWPKSVGLTRPQLRALQDSYGKLLRQLEIHYTFSSGDEEKNQVTFSISEMDKYRRAVAEARLKPHPLVVIVQDAGPIARVAQSAAPATHFPQFRFPGRLMEAALTGTLEVRNGCLMVGDTLVLWPSNARLSLDRDGVPVVGGGRDRPLRVGEQVRISGGTAWTDFRGEGLLQPLPAACKGEAWDSDTLWIAGEF
ncbi:MAG TPA: hypothetical protein VGB57_02285 [Allosphingosinicella sp.]